MRAWNYAGRVAKDILRDPISYIFTLGMPVALMIMYYCIGKSVNGTYGAGTFPMGEARIFAPGMTVFSFSFTMLNMVLLVSKDRTSSFLARLYNSPMTALSFLVGYSIPLFLMSLVQALVCFICAFCLGLTATPSELLMTALALLPSILLYLGFGLLYGSFLNDKSGPPLASMTVTVSTLLAGVWFDINMMGETFRKICFILPFANGVQAAREALDGSIADMWKPFLITLAWAAALYILAAAVFSRKMKKDND